MGAPPAGVFDVHLCLFHPTKITNNITITRHPSNEMEPTAIAAYKYPTERKLPNELYNKSKYYMNHTFRRLAYWRRRRRRRRRDCDIAVRIKWNL